MGFWERPPVDAGGAVGWDMASSSPSAADLRAVLHEPRVQRALALALRDRRMQATFDEMRASGRGAAEAIEALTGPYADERGTPYFLSEERVRYRLPQRVGFARQAEVDGVSTGRTRKKSGAGRAGGGWVVRTTWTGRAHRPSL